MIATIKIRQAMWCDGCGNYHQEPMDAQIMGYGKAYVTCPTCGHRIDVSGHVKRTPTSG